MTISLSNAEAARNALKGLSGSTLASLMIANKHLFEKHLAKGKAKEAVERGEGPQGYFKKEQTHQFNNAQEFKDLKVKDSQKAKWLASKKIDAVNSKTAKKVHGEMTVHGTAENELGNLLLKAFAATAYQLYRSDDNPDTRFLFVTAVPNGFVGRTMKANGTKDTNVGWVIIVVNAATVTNPQLVTVFPTNDAYVHALTPLV
jgi:hypothetical protein